MMYQAVALLATFSIPSICRASGEGECCGQPRTYQPTGCTPCPGRSNGGVCTDESHGWAETHCGDRGEGCQITCFDTCPQRDYGCGCGVTDCDDATKGVPNAPGPVESAARRRSEGEGGNDAKSTWKARYLESINFLWAVSKDCQDYCILSLGAEPLHGYNDARLNEFCVVNSVWESVKSHGLNSPRLPIGWCSLKCAIGGALATELVERFRRENIQWQETCVGYNNGHYVGLGGQPAGKSRPRATNDRNQPGSGISSRSPAENPHPSRVGEIRYGRGGQAPDSDSSDELACNEIDNPVECTFRDECNPFPMDTDSRELTCHSLDNVVSTMDNMDINESIADIDAAMCENEHDCRASSKCFEKQGRCVSVVQETFEKLGRVKIKDDRLLKIDSKKGGR